MNCYFDKHDLGLISDALESYVSDIEEGENNGHSYPYNTEDVEILVRTIVKMLKAD
jgi:hypothetical protein